MAKRKNKQKQPHEGEATPAAAPVKPSAKAPVLKRRTLPNWPLLALALAGMVLAGYLSYTSWSKATPLYCTEGSGCDLVQSSRWGTFLGLPTAFWGFLAYATLGYIALRVRDGAWHWKLSWIVTLIGLAVSIYLTAISLLVVRATCYYCLTSLGLMGAGFVVAALQKPAGLPVFSWPAWAGQTALLAVALVAGLHLYYSGTFDAAMGPEDPYLQGLAQHLTRSGAVFYGAYW